VSITPFASQDDRFVRPIGGALLDVFGELLRLHDFVDQRHLRALAANAVGVGAEDVGMIATDFAFSVTRVRPAGAGQNAEERKLGRLTAEERSSMSTISSHARASS